MTRLQVAEPIAIGIPRHDREARVPALVGGPESTPALLLSDSAANTSHNPGIFQFRMA